MPDLDLSPRYFDPDVELRAEKTMFFSKGKGEGLHSHIVLVDYRCILRGHLFEPIEQVRAITASQPREAVERDVGYLLQAVNWRHHFVACAAMVGSISTPALCGLLWSALVNGTWGASQVAATAWFLDPAFVDKALRVLSSPQQSPRTLLSLAALLEGRMNMTLPRPVQERIARFDAKIDCSGDGDRALRWAMRFDAWSRTEAESLHLWQRHAL